MGDLVTAVAALVRIGAEVVEAEDIAAHAAEYAAAGWRVFPLRGKVPAVAGGRGMLDATTDLRQVAAWWDGPHRGANIGLRPPPTVVVLDVDPRHGGLDSLAALTSTHGALTATLKAVSGRGDGGCHLYFRRPPGKLSARRLGAGIDLKTESGYLVAPPSLHPDTGRPYMWASRAPIAAPPAWLATLLVEPEPAPAPTVSRPRPLAGLFGESIADAFTDATSWADVLGPHGWSVVAGDGESDGSAWRHPAATNATSATVRHGLLFVYSSNTPLEPTEPSAPRGYTRFRAWAGLNFGGNLSAAARAFRATGEV